MGIFSKIDAFLQGKKTYIVAIGIGVGIVLNAFGIAIPELVWGILAALGLGAIRSAINKINQPPAA